MGMTKHTRTEGDTHIHTYHTYTTHTAVAGYFDISPNYSAVYMTLSVSGFFFFFSPEQPIDPELCSYIKSFNPEATAEKLGNTLNLQEPCLRNLRIAETLLMEGVAAGLTLYDIAWWVWRA